jgi:hypothetical protein
MYIASETVKCVGIDISRWVMIRMERAEAGVISPDLHTILFHHGSDVEPISDFFKAIRHAKYSSKSALLTRILPRFS